MMYRGITIDPARDRLLQKRLNRIFKAPDEDKAKDIGWEWNRKEDSPKNLPWPEENESKD